MPKPPPLIPIYGLGGTQGELLHTPKSSMNSPSFSVEMDSHGDPQSSNVVKYTLMPRFRGLPIFLSGVA